MPAIIARLIPAILIGALVFLALKLVQAIRELPPKSLDRTTVVFVVIIVTAVAVIAGAYVVSLVG